MRNVITNYQVSLLRSLQESFARAEQIKMVVSFVLESGVRLLLPDLQRAVERGVTVQILTSPYLNVTEPSALYLLKAVSYTHLFLWRGPVCHGLRTSPI